MRIHLTISHEQPFILADLTDQKLMTMKYFYIVDMDS